MMEPMGCASCGSASMHLATVAGTPQWRMTASEKLAACTCVGSSPKSTR
jgi:hypothetical protein